MRCDHPETSLRLPQPLKRLCFCLCLEATDLEPPPEMVHGLLLEFSVGQREQLAQNGGIGIVVYATGVLAEEEGSDVRELRGFLGVFGGSLRSFPSALGKSS